MQHTMEQVTERPRAAGLGIPMWALSLGTVIFGAGALYILVQYPAAIPLAAIAGILAVMTRVGYGQLREASQERAEASGTVANTGLIIAAVAVAPLIAFAVLWTAVLLIIGAAWLLHLIGIA